MDSKLFLSTFVLIFLAELGDKTQLAAMARSASGSRLTVFLAASAALVLSTLIAVTLGEALTRMVPESWIKLTAGGLFVLFGVLMLREAMQRPSEPTAAGAVVPATIGPVAQLALSQAIAFEEAAEADYRRLAAQEHPSLRPLLLTLAAEEQDHLDRLKGIARTHDASQVADDAAGAWPELEEVMHDAADDVRPFIEHAAEHERATAAFYRELARVTVLPALRPLFRSLAEEEEQHARRLEASLHPDA